MKLDFKIAQDSFLKDGPMHDAWHKLGKFVYDSSYIEIGETPPYGHSTKINNPNPLKKDIRKMKRLRKKLCEVIDNL